MERKAVLQLAQRVYGENDKRVKKLNELFKHANNEIVDVLSTLSLIHISEPTRP